MSETTKYAATVASVSDEGTKVLAHAFGSFALANQAAKAGYAEIKDKSGEFRVTFAKVAEDGSETTIVNVSADADVVTYVAKKKIAVIRRELNPAETNDNPAADSE